jgi:hypothetical protein
MAQLAGASLVACSSHAAASESSVSKEIVYEQCSPRNGL